MSTRTRQTANSTLTEIAISLVLAGFFGGSLMLALHADVGDPSTSGPAPAPTLSCGAEVARAAGRLQRREHRLRHAAAVDSSHVRIGLPRACDAWPQPR